MRAVLCGAVIAVSACGLPAVASAQQDSMLGLVQVDFKPTGRAQLAIWLERADGTFLSTVRLTEAVALRGIGNRPGASEMNSGFRWPYGRREGVLPVWATRRLSAPGALPFRRVIFQDRVSEGLASRTSPDQSRDDYYCLSFDQSRSTKEALDAVSCASVFSSDKGRFIHESDIGAQYSEPYERPGTRDGTMRPLSFESLYPPRHDIRPCISTSTSDDCNDHTDPLLYNAHVHEVMPDIDAVTMATPVADVPRSILYPVPSDWPPGAYRACLEINVEGDYNDTFNATAYPTPMNPGGGWDSYALTWGYPYRGQPSVVYCADIQIGAKTEQVFTTSSPAGSAGSWDYENPSFGVLRPIDGMTDDPVAAPGSGVDRLKRMPDGSRLNVTVKPGLSCVDNTPPSAVQDFTVQRHPDKLNAHQWASLSFGAAADDQGVVSYEVRVSTEPIVDATSFEAGAPVKQATIEAAELLIPTAKTPGERIGADFGGLVAQTHYYIAIRAMDGCTVRGPLSVAELTTPARVFTTVTPCFVATAAFGDPLAERVAVLRGFRDRFLLSNGIGRALVAGYYAVGPVLADTIREHDTLRAAARSLLEPIVELTQWLDAPAGNRPSRH